MSPESRTHISISETLIKVLKLKKEARQARGNALCISLRRHLRVKEKSNGGEIIWISLLGDFSKKKRVFLRAKTHKRDDNLNVFSCVVILEGKNGG